MKIVMICDFYHENFQYQENFLAKYYIKFNHEVTIIASTYTSGFDYYANNYDKNIKSHNYYINGYRIFRLPYRINLLGKLKKLSSVRTILSKESPDIIYVHGPILNLIDAVNYKTKNPSCKILFDFHGDFSNSANKWLSLHILHKIIYRTVIKLYYKQVDKIFYVTPGSGEFLNQVYGIPYNRMNLFPLGADLDLIKSIQESGVNIKIRKQLGIDTNDFVIFTGGKITRKKQTNLIIEAFLSISNNNSIHLIIVGDTDDDVYKKEILNLINFHPRIHYIGWVEGDEVYNYMSACDIAVYPSSQSILWQQSIGMGLPLIIGQIENEDASYLNRNNNIIFLDKNSITKESIRSKIQLLVQNKNLLITMKNDALKTAEEFLSYEKLTESTLE